MYCSNCGAEVKGRFCSRCGTKIEEPVRSAEPVVKMAEHTSTTETKREYAEQHRIVIRSESCTELIEKKKKEKDNQGNRGMGMISFAVLAVIFSPAIVALLEDKKISQVDPVPMPVMILMALLFAVMWYLVIKGGKRTSVTYNQYKQYCATEVLVVEDDRIYGSTAKGKLVLKFDQIDSVKCTPDVFLQPNDASVNNGWLSNDTLSIKDIVGNEYIFYSFKNCKDIKTIIDMKIGR